MANFCPDLSIDPAVLLTLQAHDRFTELGTRTYELANSDLSAFGSVNLTPMTFNVSFDFDGELTQFQRPTRPTLDASAFEFRDPGDVADAPDFVPNAITIDDAPVFDAAPPALNFGPRPNRPDVVAPTPPPRPGPIRLHDEPDYAQYIPDRVTLETLNLPTLGEIRLPEFTDTAPVLVNTDISGDYTFVPEAYTSAMLQDLQTKLRAMIQGQQMLPMAIQRAILDRGRDRAEVEGQRALEQVYDEFASRGFSEPNGLLAARVADQRQATQNAIGELNRDLTIKDFEEALVNLRFAITQGAALEGVTIQLHATEQQLALQAVQFARETDIAVLNARIAAFNATMTGYQVGAQVFEIRIRAELAKLDEYRARLEAEKLRGEINQQTVQLYAEQWRAVATISDFYRSRIEAVKVEADLAKLPIEIYREEVNAFGERWRAYASEIQGYAAGNDAEGKKADVYETLSKIFATRMQGYDTEQTVRARVEDLRIRQHGQRLEVWNAGLRRKASLLEAERGRLTAVAQKADADARLYTADASIAQAQSASEDRSFQLALERDRAEIDAQLKVAELKLQQYTGLLQQQVELLRARAQISGQLAASTLSAVNYGASVSSGRSQSKSCSENFSFAGEIVDAG